VELGGLEPPTPCLQSDVFACGSGPDLRSRLSVRDRHVPLVTGGNGTLMARDLDLGGWREPGRDRVVRAVWDPDPGQGPARTRGLRPHPTPRTPASWPCRHPAIMD
jgi:hypothetical protein